MTAFKAISGEGQTVVVSSGIVSAPIGGGEAIYNIYRNAAGMLEWDTTGSSVASGLNSVAPSGAFEITNIYRNSSGALEWVADDTPTP